MDKSLTLKNVMQDYFSEESPINTRLLNETSLCIAEEVPVRVMTSSWELVASPNRLMKTFEFNTFDFLKAFLDELLNYQEDVGHHGKLTIDARKIIVEIYTHGIDDITELDTEYATMADGINDDIKHFIAFDVATERGGYYD